MINIFPISQGWLIAIALNTFLGAIALILPRKVLTTAGIYHAWILGIVIWGCLGWQGYIVILSYLIIGSGVTRIGKEIKEAKGIAEKRDGARGPENLWGSAATGAVCAIGYAIEPSPLWLIAYVASLSTKLADTAASEIGKAYGCCQPRRHNRRDNWFTFDCSDQLGGEFISESLGFAVVRDRGSYCHKYRKSDRRNFARKI